MPEEYDISIIEQYLSEEMVGQEKIAFEEAIKSEPGLQEEVDAYHKLFQGFNGLREEYFMAQLSQWSQEWIDIDQEESSLIEAYHEGTLSTAQIKQIEKRIAKDKAFAKKIEDYKNLFSGFEALQSESFSKKMKNWTPTASTMKVQQKEGKIRRLRPIFTRIAIAASFLLLVSLGMNWYANNNYGSTALMSRYYKAPSNTNTMGGDTQQANQIKELYEQAHKFLQQAEYNKAFAAFEQLEAEISKIENDPFTKTYYQNQIEWNKALAALGEGKPAAETLQMLEAIRNNPQQEYQKQADQLIQQMKSFWWRLGN